MLDVFNSSAFTTLRLTQALNELKFVPGRIGQLGLFETERSTTTQIAVEKRGEILSLVPPTPRGAPGVSAAKEKRDLRSFVVPHFEINDAIYAEEVQNVRAFGSEDSLQTVIDRVNARLASHNNSMASTEEYARIGAIKGIVTYSDGSTLNLFTEFGVTQETEIDFDLDNATPVDGVLRKRCAAVVRQVAGILDGLAFTRLHAFCGDAFYDDLIAHKEVRETYKNQTEASQLRSAYVAPGALSFGAFEFGGITFENYRGAVGGTSFVATDKCHVFPIGVPGLFKSVYAPADYEETVNTLGERLYARQYAMSNGKGRHLDVQMNALQYCSRPKALIQLRRT
jgi:hypothetical protein